MCPLQHPHTVGGGLPPPAMGPCNFNSPFHMARGGESHSYSSGYSSQQVGTSDFILFINSLRYFPMFILEGHQRSQDSRVSSMQSHFKVSKIHSLFLLTVILNICSRRIYFL